MKTVDFLIVGAQKSGTTALYEYLNQHPDVCMARPKELRFFENEDHYRTTPVAYDQYHAHFHPEHQAQRWGEASPAYMYWNRAPERIHAYKPEIKLVVILRNPIERAYSHWNMSRLRGVETLPFLDALQAEKDRLPQTAPLQNKPYSYTDRGYYSRQLERLYRYFHQDNILVLRHDSLRDDPENLQTRLCHFLGINPYQDIPLQKAYALPYPSTMSRQAWQYLKTCYTAEISQLEQALGWDCSQWLEPPPSQSRVDKR